MQIEACFLDVDGVINDHALMPAMWDRHMGEVLAPALGREPADWGRANRKVWPPLWREQESWGTDPMERIRIESRLIITAMCDELGLTAPSDDACFELWREVDLYIAATAAAAFPFAAESIRTLASLATVHTATGNPSWRVETLLGALAVREHIGFPAGPDLVGIWKNSTSYYERVLERTGVEPAAALIIDDSEDCLAFAKPTGARTAHIWGTDCRCPATFHAGSLAEVPRLLTAGLSLR